MYRCGKSDGRLKRLSAVGRQITMRQDETGTYESVPHKEAGSYTVTYRNGSGYRLLRAREVTRTSSGIDVVDVDGLVHFFASGSDVHVKELAR